MTIWCKNVHKLELQKFFLIFCAAQLPVKRDIETKFHIYISNFGHACLYKKSEISSCSHIKKTKKLPIFFIILAWLCRFNCFPLEVVGRSSEIQLQVDNS